MSSAKPGTTVRQKEVLAILDLVEWKSTPDISTWLGIDTGMVANILKTLLKAGLVEKMYDEEIGRSYWRLPEGETFHRASEEVRM